MAGKGKLYTLSFTQWDLPVLVNVDAYEGSCTLVSLDAGQGMGAGPICKGMENSGIWFTAWRTASRSNKQCVLYSSTTKLCIVFATEEMQRKNEMLGKAIGRIW